MRLFLHIIAALIIVCPSLGAETKTINILCIGDSITQGGRNDRDEFTYRYPLFQMLTDAGIFFDFIGTRQQGLHPDFQWPNYKDKKFDPDHEGYYGAKTAYVRDQLKENLPKLPPPDIALIHLGTNDQKADDYREAVLKPLKEIVDLLRNQNPQVKILIGHLNFNGGAALKIRPVVGEITKYSKENSPIVTVDHYQGWHAKPDHPSTDTFDWAHPNPKGQRKMAEKWWDAMKPFIK
jgi:lysophospholipase L1-like esterase